MSIYGAKVLRINTAYDVESEPVLPVVISLVFYVICVNFRILFYEIYAIYLFGLVGNECGRFDFVVQQPVANVPSSKDDMIL